MDSLIVLRRPLKTVANKKKLIKPVKPRLTSKVKPSEIDAPSSSQKTNEKYDEKISFVKLYNELCLYEDPVETGESRKVKSTTDIAKTTKKVSKKSQANMSSESADAVLKKPKKLKKPKFFKKAVNTEVMLELDYDSNSNKSKQFATKK